MPGAFKSQLSIQIKGIAGQPTINRKYALDSSDELQLMDHAHHLIGLQSDLVSTNRVGLTSDPQAMHKPKGPVSLTIKSETAGDDGKPAHEATISWHGIDSSQVNSILALVNARLVSLGLTP